ncbi:TPA: hypothetical protein N0F65_003304 [Lagenidium giganteum]|uniref:SWIM-type domain-containing protein n=1 Tax=Lagenidium giganteum TaxID=4803 RepID=A0AAV2YT74_9STRA|nr:TPA: hypothetical protein N0F65_003304 [Lagenidium giganteum]
MFKPFVIISGERTPSGTKAEIFSQMCSAMPVARHYEIGKAKYGMTDWQKRNMRLAVKALVYAFSESEYKKKIGFMKSLLGSPDKIAIWFEYFYRNWDECRKKWCAYLRCTVPHLGNNTNNHLESSWHKLKSLVSKFKPFDECVVSILFWQKTREEAWKREIGKIDREINALAAIVSRYALDLVRAQYEFAMRTSTTYTYYPLIGPIWLILVLGTKEWICSCPFMMTRLLPCRHVLYIRRKEHPQEIILLSKVNDRWRSFHLDEEYDEDAEDTEEYEDSGFDTCPMVEALQLRELSANERFNRCEY